MRMSDWILLQTLYECRNLTKAAKLLYLTQPTVTKRLKEMETELQTKIAERGKKGIVFTEAGEYLAARAAQINEIMEQTKRYLSQTAEERKTVLKIGASNSLSRFSMPAILGKYRTEHPGVQYALFTDNSTKITKLLERGKIDIGFICGDIPFSGERQFLGTEQAYLASSSPIDLSGAMPKSLPFIKYLTDPYSLKLIEAWWQEQFFTPLPQGCLTVENAGICKEMILRGLGFSIFFTAGYMEDFPEMKYPLYHKDKSPLVRRTWIIYKSGARADDQVRQFLDAVCDEADRVLNHAESIYPA